MPGNETVTVDEHGRPRDNFGNHAAAFVGGEYVDQPDKGEPGGSCNVRSCQRPLAFWLNVNNHNKYYCQDCAHRLNRANTGRVYWEDLVLDKEAMLKYPLTLKLAA